MRKVDKAMGELKEKIQLTKDAGTWDGVDVDAYMDEVRGKTPDNKKMAANLISELCNLKVRGLIKESTYEKYKDWLKSLYNSEGM